MRSTTCRALMSTLGEFAGGGVGRGSQGAGLKVEDAAQVAGGGQVRNLLPEDLPSCQSFMRWKPSCKRDCPPQIPVSVWAANPSLFSPTQILLRRWSGLRVHLRAMGRQRHRQRRQCQQRYGGGTRPRGWTCGDARHRGNGNGGGGNGGGGGGGGSGWGCSSSVPCA